jgi:hypothetical protein
MVLIVSRSTARGGIVGLSIGRRRAMSQLVFRTSGRRICDGGEVDANATNLGVSRLSLIGECEVRRTKESCECWYL